MSVKQWIIVRKDLNMRKGKMVAQGAHASMAAIFKLNRSEDSKILSIRIPEEYNDWFSGSFTKICLYVNSEEELLSIYKQALDRGLLCAIIKDSGETEFKGVPTYTAVAIGPAHKEEVDSITRPLKLM